MRLLRQYIKPVLRRGSLALQRGVPKASEVLAMLRFLILPQKLTGIPAQNIK